MRYWSRAAKSKTQCEFSRQRRMKSKRGTCRWPFVAPVVIEIGQSVSRTLPLLNTRPLSTPLSCHHKYVVGLWSVALLYMSNIIQLCTSATESTYQLNLSRGPLPIMHDVALMVLRDSDMYGEYNTPLVVSQLHAQEQAEAASISRNWGSTS